MEFTAIRAATRPATFAGILLALALAEPKPSDAGATAPAARAVRVGTSTFADPVYVTVAPGMNRYLFVVERPGTIQILFDERKRTQPFLDIRSIVYGLPDAGAGPEQGLLSMAFPPNYASSGRFYVYFTNLSGNIEINEFRRSAASPERADPTTRRRLLTIPHPGAQNHNGGQLQFDASGLLFIATGDGGTGGEPARDLTSLLGKILRINPLQSGASQYTIPAGNPFSGGGRKREIFAYGLRHPWRFSIDGDRIAIGDVGQSQREEVDYLTIANAIGTNFGWPQYEGELLNNASLPGPTPPKFPMFTYSHDSGGCAIIGGYAVRDASFTSAFRGRYVYGDTCTGEVRSFAPDITRNRAQGDGATGITLPGLSSFGLGFRGQVYMTELGTNRVWRLEPP